MCKLTILHPPPTPPKKGTSVTGNHGLVLIAKHGKHVIANSVIEISKSSDLWSMWNKRVYLVQTGALHLVHTPENNTLYHKF